MKLINYLVNFAFKLSKIASNGVSMLNNLLTQKKKDNANAFYQRDGQIILNTPKCRCYFEEVEEIPKINYGVK